jgi:hypothetical protein
VTIGVPESYRSGDPLNSLTTFADNSFESLGIDVGTYTWALPHDSVVLTVVPEPTAALLIAGGLLGIAGWRRREHP